MSTTVESAFQRTAKQIFSGGGFIDSGFMGRDIGISLVIQWPDMQWENGQLIQIQIVGYGVAI